VSRRGLAGVLVVLGLLSGCASTAKAPTGGGPLASAPASPEHAAPQDADLARQSPFVRRPFAPLHDGEPVKLGMAYGPYRQGQHPDAEQPTAQQMLQDLRILEPDWPLIRVYGSGPTTGTLLRLIAEHDLDIDVVLGAWIAPDAPEDNHAEVQRAILLARTFPDQVVAVAVGNETQVDWSAHRSSQQGLIRHLRTVRAAVDQPVTTADDYNFWNKERAQEVAAEVDFVLTHAHPLWNGQQLDEALAWTDATVADIEARHPGVPVVLGEVGWATEHNPQGHEAQYMKAPTGEAEQARFYAELAAWAAQREQPTFWFEAFDEPWKGGTDARDAEKHWGLYRVDRTPKAALGPDPGEAAE